MLQNRKLKSSLKRLVLTVILLTFAVGVSACSGQSAFTSQGRIKVTATIGMINDVVKQVGGEHVEAIALMQAGVDPHLYKATQGDLKKLEDADIVFYNGLHLEGKMADILEKMNDKKPSVAVTKNIDKSKLRAGEDGQSHDPHVWFDVRLWMSATETIRDELVKLDPANKADYDKHAELYLKKLQELHEYAMAQMGSIPKQSRVLVTAHDAFGYFGAAYDVKVSGLQGISTASEAGIKDVGDLRDFLVQNKIKAVFVESSVPKKTIQAVVDGARQKGHNLLIGGELFSDAMGEEGTEEGTYIGMVKHNVDTIVKALK